MTIKEQFNNSYEGGWENFVKDVQHLMGQQGQSAYTLGLGLVLAKYPSKKTGQPMSRQSFHNRHWKDRALEAEAVK